MAKKKATRKKKQGKKTQKKSRTTTDLKKIVAGLSILIILVIGAGILAHYLLGSGSVSQTSVSSPSIHKNGSFSKTARTKEPVPYQKKGLRPKKTYKVPRYEIYPKSEIPAQRLARGKEFDAHEAMPRVAIIIDDVGYDKKIADRFLALDAVLTFSVLPFSPFKDHIVKAAHNKKIDIMLHLPMEPIEYPSVKPGPGGLFSSMSPDQLIDQLNRNIRNIPHVKGVNNHMGSRLTTVSSQMNQVFSILKKKGLYFIDSRTTADTLCYQSARLFQVPFAERSVFLDHVQDPAFIRRQLRKLVRDAVKNGEAVGIAHPHMVTYGVLKEGISELKKKVRLVPASEIVHLTGGA